MPSMVGVNAVFRHRVLLTPRQQVPKEELLSWWSLAFWLTSLPYMGAWADHCQGWGRCRAISWTNTGRGCCGSSGVVRRVRQIHKQPGLQGRKDSALERESVGIVARMRHWGSIASAKSNMGPKGELVMMYHGSRRRLVQTKTTTCREDSHVSAKVAPGGLGTG